MTDRREALLQAATGWIVENGVGNLSLRPLAAAIGTSDRMLIYYFGSKEQLLDAVVAEAAAGMAAGFPAPDLAKGARSARAWLDACWGLLADPALRPLLSLLFELDSRGIRIDGPERAAAQVVGATWTTAVGDALTALGVPARRRRAVTPLVAAALVGMVLDHLVQDDPAPPGPTFALLASVIDAERT